MVYGLVMAPRKSPAADLVYMIGDTLDSTPTPIAEGVYLPFTRYKGTTTLGPYEVTITAAIKDRQVTCQELTVKSRDGSPITATSLREIPVAAMLNMSINMFSPYRVDEEGNQVPVQAQSAVDARAAERGKRTPREEVLPKVVEAYRAALANPRTRDRATQAVADQLGYQRGYISRLLSDARKMDPPLLGPAKRGKSGEWAE